VAYIYCHGYYTLNFTVHTHSKLSEITLLQTFSTPEKNQIILHLILKNQAMLSFIKSIAQVEFLIIRQISTALFTISF